MSYLEHVKLRRRREGALLVDEELDRGARLLRRRLGRRLVDAAPRVQLGHVERHPAPVHQAGERLQRKQRDVNSRERGVAQ